MTATADTKAVTVTTNAKTAAIKAGTDIVGLQNHLILKLAEAQVILKQIIALTPSGDANLTALNSLLAELV